ncbi:metabolite traffic protein EboE [Nocardioides sp. dk4132]|uniref:metabolite traffic protein EboE n=1 Tax=unclassified Nocardioides TaxID=2615069 RepID=UPI0012951485|nr:MULTISPECIES: metabolite traffic protein EboE [unclassified Nocardioides]MQW74982.1 metabolite traffic protein EboE [Nocardioides sp. dk4132]QGA07835.1 metabolite traffic protein EboE [Nocardioides sp. dk884]
MRLRHPDGTVVHLGYGTNVLPAEDVDGLVAQAVGMGGRIRRALAQRPEVPGASACVGLGLWLPAAAAHRLAADPAGVRRIRDRLAEHGVEVVTVNAFPFAAFQGAVVKHSVYLPTWASTERLDYTLGAARVLAGLLPDDADHGSISSLPFAWRTPWSGEDQHRAEAQLAGLARGLAEIEDATGRRVVVGLEPEPGCVVETVEEAVDRLAEVDRDRIGVCLDLCHLAVGFDDADRALKLLDEAGLRVVKAQPASALVVDDPADRAARTALASYAEDRFLHQVRQARPDGRPLAARDDLPEALDGPDPLAVDAPWRVHFHVPVHADPRPPLRTGRAELRASLAALLGGPTARVAHLEVETYTWSVLPGGPPADDDALAAGLAAELAWVHAELVGLGLTPI